MAGVLALVTAYSLFTLTTKPAYWYDEAINVELARNFADFGRLDLIVAPDTFSGKGATVGSTGYPVTVPLAGFFKAFGFGLEQARLYMLLWMSACIIAFFFFAQKLWGPLVAYGGTALLATFAPFYGNGRSVMGEIPGFLFFLLSFYFLEQRRWYLSGILLGLSVVAKPSVFIFLIPAYALILLCRSDAWRNKLVALVRLWVGSLLALLPWFAIYADELARGGIGADILAHFKNPYAEAGVSALENITQNLPTLFASTTLLYMWVMLTAVIAALFLERTLFRTHQSFFILAVVYFPLAFLQYLKSFGYLRYFIVFELFVFMLFLLALPVLVRHAVNRFRYPRLPVQAGQEGDSENAVLPDSRLRWNDGVSLYSGAIVVVMVVVQIVHLFWFSDLYFSEKTQKTLAYLSSAYPESMIGVMNVPHIGSLLASEKKYQYLSTYGLWQFGVNPLLLPSEKLPPVLVMEHEDNALSPVETAVLAARYEKNTAFFDGFIVYKKK